MQFHVEIYITGDQVLAVNDSDSITIFPAPIARARIIVTDTNDSIVVTFIILLSYQSWCSNTSEVCLTTFSNSARDATGSARKGREIKPGSDSNLLKKTQHLQEYMEGYRTSNSEIEAFVLPTVPSGFVLSCCAGTLVFCLDTSSNAAANTPRFAWMKHLS